MPQASRATRLNVVAVAAALAVTLLVALAVQWTGKQQFVFIFAGVMHLTSLLIFWLWFRGRFTPVNVDAGLDTRHTHIPPVISGLLPYIAQKEGFYKKYGVNVVYSGHDHVYERIKPQKGIYYWVVGSAGQLREGNMSPTEQTAASFDRDRAFLAVEISGNDLFFQAISRTGQTVDSGAISRQGAGS